MDSKISQTHLAVGQARPTDLSKTRVEKEKERIFWVIGFNLYIKDKTQL